MVSRTTMCRCVHVWESERVSYLAPSAFDWFFLLCQPCHISFSLYNIHMINLSITPFFIHSSSVLLSHPQIAALSHLRHPFIVPVLGVSSSADNKSFAVVFEPMLFCYPPQSHVHLLSHSLIFLCLPLSFFLSLHSEKTLESFVRDESIEGSTRLALVAEMFDGLRFMHEFSSLFVFIALFSCLSVSNTYTHTRTHTHTHIW